MSLRRTTKAFFRASLSLGIGALAAASLAQAGRSKVEEVVNDALVTLRAHNRVFFQLNGSETVNGRQTLLTYNVSFEADTDATGSVTGAFVDVEAIRAGVFDHRICGDGVTLWKYLPKRATYQPLRYGTEHGPQPSNYLDSLLNKLDSVGDVYESRIATLLRQTYASDGTNYESWMPGIDPTIVAGNIFYLDGSPPIRGLTFSLTADTNGNLGLATVDFFDNTSTGHISRAVSWHMSLNKDLQYLPGTFVFAPPHGTRPVKS